MINSPYTHVRKNFLSCHSTSKSITLLFTCSTFTEQKLFQSTAMPPLLPCGSTVNTLWKPTFYTISSRYHLLFFVSLKNNISRKYWNIRVFSTPLQFQLNILITKLKGLNYPSTLLHDCFHLPMLTLGQNGWELLLPYEQNDVIQTNSFHQTSFYHHNLYYGIQAFETSMEV